MTFAISWSRLDCAEKCPLLCYWKNFAPKEQRIPFVENEHLVRGRLWHKWMEDACKGVADLPPQVAKFKPIVAALRNDPGDILVEHKVTLTEKYQRCDWFSKQAYWRTIFDIMKIRSNGLAFSLDWKTGNLNQSAIWFIISGRNWDEAYKAADAMLKVRGE